MKIQLVLIALFLMASLPELRSQESPDKMIEEFFERFETSGSSDALDYIYSTNNWVSKNKEAIDNLKTQLARFNNDLVGKYYGYEKITEKSIGESYSLFSYFAKFDRQFLRFTFQFYKPDDIWKIASFQFDDSFDDELEEAAKLYFLLEN